MTTPAPFPPKPCRGPTAANLTGKRFGRLLVLGYIQCPPERRTKIGIRSVWWECACDCGARHQAESRKLTKGLCVSCGCYSDEVLARAPGANKKPAGQSAFNQLLSSYKRSARSRGYEFSISDLEFASLTQSECHYCGAPPEREYVGVKGTFGSYRCNGVDRVDNAMGYSTGNCVACCSVCNVAKASMPAEDFIAWARRVVAKQSRAALSARFGT